MEQPTYLRRLLNQKILLAIGFVVAIVAGLLAGFTVDDGAVELRTQRTYTASATVLLSSPQPDYFQTEIPGSTEALPLPQEGQPTQELIVQEATPINLSDTAIILAYLAASDEVSEAVEQNLGGFETGESVTAVQRTTQPPGDETFGGRLSLPIINIVGVSTSAERSELISAEAQSVFAELIAERQDEWGVAEDIRLTLDELNAPVADEGQGSNPAIPIIVVAFGVFLLFIALALIIEAVRDRRRRADTDDDDVDGDADDDDHPQGLITSDVEDADADAAERTTAPDDLAPAGRSRRRRKSAAAPDADRAAGSVVTDDAPGSPS